MSEYIVSLSLVYISSIHTKSLGLLLEKLSSDFLSQVKDARDRLVSLNHASGVDARNKLTKIRNLKKGMVSFPFLAQSLVYIKFRVHF